MMRNIAFLGTGLMGAPMARRLLAASLPVTVWNRSAEKAEALVEHGATFAATAAAAVADADVVFIMLSDGPAVTDLLFSQGVAAALKPGTVVIDASSIPRDTAMEHAHTLQQLDVGHVDAPVSGGVVGAVAGTLAIMAGGDAALISSLADIFALLGRVTHVGPSGAGQLAKMANQQIVAITIAAVAEAMILVEAGGGSRAAFRDAIRGGFAESRILEVHGGRMVTRDFTPGGLSRLQLKDLNTVRDTAYALALQLPVTELVRSHFDTYVSNGGGETDHSALLVHLENLNVEH
jgi:2-hydroxy-3-oxopropionate reductase